MSVKDGGCMCAKNKMGKGGVQQGQATKIIMIIKIGGTEKTT